MKNKLKTFYQNGLVGATPSIDKDGVLKAVMQQWISVEDAIEIIGEGSELEVTRAVKIMEISKACGAIITAGIDVETSNGTDHFNLKLEDQANINSLFKVVELGGTEFPYQADDGHCSIYSAPDIIKIYLAAQTLITTQTTYHNVLKEYTYSLETVEEILAVQYGMDLSVEFETKMLEKLAVARTQIDAIVAKLGG